MRVKIRFNAEAGQPPVIMDLRFLPRIGERIQLGFRRVIEVLDVHRVDNDNRFGGIIRARYIHEERGTSSPSPRPMPMPPMPVRSLGGPPQRAAASAGQGAVFGDVNLEELAAQTKSTPAPIEAALTPEPAM